MAGPSLLIASPLALELTRATVASLLDRNPVDREGAEVWLTRAFQKPLPDIVPIVYDVSDRIVDDDIPRCLSVVALGAMANRPIDYAGLISFGIDVAEALSGLLLIETYSAPPSCPGVILSRTIEPPAGSLGITIYSVISSPEAVRSWWESGSLQLVK